MKMRRIAVALVMALLIGLISYGNRGKLQAATSSSEIESEQADNSEEQERLEQEKEELESQLGDLNSDLYDISMQIQETQDQIAATEEEIAQTQEELDEAEATQEKQYADMKLRIQYMYENSDQTGIAFVLSAGSFTEMLNRAEYISQISTRDRELLQDYEDTVATVSNCKAALETKQSELLAEQDALESQEQELLAAIADVNDQVAANDDALEKNQKEADELEKQLAAMKKYEEDLKKQKQGDGDGKGGDGGGKDGDGKGGDEGGKDGDGKDGDGKGGGQTPATPAVGEEELLAAIIYCEGGNQSYDFMLAVGSVVMNRVNSSSYPNTITAVIYQSGQFSPAASGRLALVLQNNLTTSACRQAAAEVIAGNITGPWIGFRYYDGTKEGTRFGNVVFFE